MEGRQSPITGAHTCPFPGAAAAVTGPLPARPLAPALPFALRPRRLGALLLQSSAHAALHSPVLAYAAPIGAAATAFVCAAC